MFHLKILVGLYPVACLATNPSILVQVWSANPGPATALLC